MRGKRAEDRGREIAEDPILDTHHAERRIVLKPLPAARGETLGTAFAVVQDVSAPLARLESDQRPQAHEDRAVPGLGRARAGPSKYVY